MALPGSAEATQKARVRMALEGGPVTTCELRRYCDILHPAGRVKSLRDAGAEIATTWVKQRTESGHLHCVGEYSLMRAPA
ncbi:MAG: helix-turn-helix domain-containing protein [Rubrivivax sp.]|nr:helix-turn-helix domain-containing protein [Rubrivivax sp.]